MFPRTKIVLIGIFILCAMKVVKASNAPVQDDDGIYPYQEMPEVLPGTKPLTGELSASELSAKILNGAHKLVDEKIRASVTGRTRLWNRNFDSHEAYEQSVEPNRKRFMRYIGLGDKDEPKTRYNLGPAYNKPQRVTMQRISTDNDTGLIAETATYRIYQVRWPVLNRVYGEGLLLQPKTKSLGHIIALPDADQLPEQLVGLSPGIPAESQFARRLAENGYRVLIPVLISRELLSPGKPQQQTYREWIYRQAFHMGRHIIGYEVQKVLAAVDWFKQSEGSHAKIGVAGYCEGGLIAMYAAAVDKRIDATLVSGYFNSRQKVWDEPIYRNVWGLLTEFGDAEIASLIAPRPLVIEYSPVPPNVEKRTKKPDSIDEFSYSGYKGSLHTPAFKEVQAEFERIDALLQSGFQSRQLINGEKNKPIAFGSERAVTAFAELLGHTSPMPISNVLPVDHRSTFDPEDRQVRQVKEIEDHIQWLVRVSDYERNRFFLYKVMPEFGERKWSTKLSHPYYSADRFIEQGKQYRTYFWKEILGKFDDPMLAPNPLTRKCYDKERWTGYEVVLDVYKDLFAAGILLIPKDMKPDERRPVVVCQHGRNGLPQSVIEGNTSYNDMAAKLADQGFIVYVPYGIYRGEDRYRWLGRKANSIKKTIFSFMISQHEQTLRWLGSLSFVDKNRIAFYGKSYGGEAAMRIPAVLEGYCLSICSGDFGDWSRKVTDAYFQGSFMNSNEWEMPYFNMGSTFSYAEMAYLIFPRPFMVERGHHDLVQPDEWVAYEYAKVRFLYDQFNRGNKTTIEYFNGGHASRNEGTFKFLHDQLKWP